MKVKPISFCLLLLTILLVASCQNNSATIQPTVAPRTVQPVIAPTTEPTAEPTVEPTTEPTDEPTSEPTVEPTAEPTVKQAALNVRFVESAPKDTFIVKNNSSCDVGELTVVINLADSAGKLIFDTTGAGAGVEVFQPFEVAGGEVELISSPTVTDGDTELTVRVARLPADTQVSFTIDVDDTLPNSELGMIQVTGSEMSGGVVQIMQGDRPSVSATFDDSSQAMLSVTCSES